jgi:integrase
MATAAERSAHGDAKIFKLADGRWCAFVELEPGADGRRRRKKITGKTQRAVIVKRNETRANLAKGIEPGDDRTSVAQLVELWLKHRKGKVTDRTLANYKTVATKHIIGTKEKPLPIGRKAAAKLTAVDVENLLLAKAEERYSPRTVKLIRTILGAALGWAVQRRMLPYNVVTWTDGPRQAQTTHRAMTEAQARAVLKAAKGVRYEAAFALMLSLGLRPGECLGLSWSDIDLKAGTLTVRHGLQRDGTLGEVKNDGSRRHLTLPAHLVPLLKARQAAQAAEILKAGEYWQGDREDPLVFTTPVGSPVSDRNLAQRDFRTVCTKAKVGDWHLHECRHTSATLMLTNGVPIEVVAKVLGHADIRMTANTYAHLTPRHLAPAAEKISAVLWK